MYDLTNLTSKELATRQKALEEEITANEEEIRINKKELDEIYTEQDRRTFGFSFGRKYK